MTEVQIADFRQYCQQPFLGILEPGWERRFSFKVIGTAIVSTWITSSRARGNGRSIFPEVPRQVQGYTTTMALFSAVQEVLHALRGKRDALNSAAAGAVAGAFMNRRTGGKQFTALGALVWAPICGGLHVLNDFFQFRYQFEEYMINDHLLDPSVRELRPEAAPVNEINYEHIPSFEKRDAADRLTYEQEMKEVMHDAMIITRHEIQELNQRLVRESKTVTSHGYYDDLDKKSSGVSQSGNSGQQPSSASRYDTRPLQFTSERGSSRSDDACGSGNSGGGTGISEKSAEGRSSSAKSRHISNGQLSTWRQREREMGYPDDDGDEGDDNIDPDDFEAWLHSDAGASVVKAGDSFLASQAMATIKAKRRAAAAAAERPEAAAGMLQQDSSGDGLAGVRGSSESHINSYRSTHSGGGNGSSGSEEMVDGVDRFSGAGVGGSDGSNSGLPERPRRQRGNWWDPLFSVFSRQKD